MHQRERCSLIQFLWSESVETNEVWGIQYGDSCTSHRKSLRAGGVIQTVLIVEFSEALDCIGGPRKDCHTWPSTQPVYVSLVAQQGEALSRDARLLRIQQKLETATVNRTGRSICTC
jgi:hypothetical protein